jgi:hypothetical protein
MCKERGCTSKMLVLRQSIWALVENNRCCPMIMQILYPLEKVCITAEQSPLKMVLIEE